MTWLRYALLAAWFIGANIVTDTVHGRGCFPGSQLPDLVSSMALGAGWPLLIVVRVSKATVDPSYSYRALQCLRDPEPARPPSDGGVRI